ncbi:MAG TPA: cation diffusion facilitator family transporter [Pyrinomonadaceae bacterium]|nr:cation diffusion facilitator family transporter [Pyrinomonadaceae bacterium]
MGRPQEGLTKLKVALVITAVYMFAEAIGGWLANSLALLADAGHMLTDVAAMSLTLFAFWFAARPATSEKTYGYYRLEILVAFINGVVLCLLSLWVIIEAVSRWQDPPEVKGFEMLLIASGGLVVNIIAAVLLHSGHNENLNMRSAFLHVVGDLLGSVAAISAGVLIILFGWMWADALGSVFISLIIIVGAWRLILDSVNVLLEGTPPHIRHSTVETAILDTPGVRGIHDLHIWTISSGIHALSVHINHDESVAHSDLLAAVRDRLHDGFGIDHLTIQMETMNSETEAVYICETGTKCFEPSSRSKSTTS